MFLNCYLSVSYHHIVSAMEMLTIILTPLGSFAVLKRVISTSFCNRAFTVTHVQAAAIDTQIKRQL